MTAGTDVLEVPPEVIARLFQVLKRWAGEGMDAFRYEMFAKRLRAAEYGRPDAVEWARQWHADLVLEEQLQAEAKAQERAWLAGNAAKARAEFLAGRCGNPHYQAYLDTVEDPSRVMNNAGYFAWFSETIGKFNGLPDVKKLPPEERQVRWRQFLEAERDANLAPRLNGKPNPLHFR